MSVTLSPDFSCAHFQYNLLVETFLETIFLGMDYFSSKNFEIVTGSAASLKLVVGNRISQVHIRNFFSKCNFFGGNDIMFLQKNLW